MKKKKPCYSAHSHPMVSCQAVVRGETSGSHNSRKGPLWHNTSHSSKRGSVISMAQYISPNTSQFMTGVSLYSAVDLIEILVLLLDVYSAQAFMTSDVISSGAL